MKKMMHKTMLTTVLVAICLAAGCGQKGVEENNMQNQENAITVVPTVPSPVSGGVSGAEHRNPC
jgi:hypothetical protein